MKRLFSLLLIFCCLLSGCSLFSEKSSDQVTFYYLRNNYHEDMDSLFQAEKRDAAGHRDDLSYLLALYLIGPSGDDLVSPIPKGTRIFSAIEEGQTVSLRLSDTEKTMTDVQFSLACACLSMTCFDLTDAQDVTIVSGSRTITMTRDNLILIDSGIAATEETQ